MSRWNQFTTIPLGLTLLFWSSAFVGIRMGLESYNPGHLALLRFLLASIILGRYGAISQIRLPELRNLPAIFLAGFFGVTLYHLSLNRAELTITAGAASMLGNTVPIFTCMLSRFLLDERIHLWGWIGIMISFTGGILIALGEGEGIHLNFGAVFSLIAALSQAIYFILQKPYLKKYTPLELTTYCIISGSILLLIFLPGFSRTIAKSTMKATAAVAYLAVFSTCVGYVCWAHVLARLQAGRASGFLYLIPALTILIAWLTLREVPALLSLLGGVVAMLGVVLMNNRHLRNLSASKNARNDENVHHPGAAPGTGIASGCN